MRRIIGLNSLRFVCAIWVVIAHLGLPHPAYVEVHNDFISRMTRMFLDNSFSGISAVIAFFVISGICIHVSYFKDQRINSLPEYFTRRFVRILPPLLIAAYFGEVLRYRLHDLILWSLYCELLYYLLYPLLLVLRRKGVSWSIILTVSFVAALSVMMMHSSAKSFYEPGIWFTWILGLPCWIMGCIIVEKWTNGDLQGTNRIGLWRFLIWCGSVICSILRFHSPIGYVWTIPVFGIGIAYWISKEIVNFSKRPPALALEQFGEWSFSLYLVHILGFAVCDLVLKKSSASVMWFAHLAFALGAAYLFALLVEFPSHKLAKKWASKIRSKDRLITVGQ